MIILSSVIRAIEKFWLCHCVDRGKTVLRGLIFLKSLISDFLEEFFQFLAIIYNLIWRLGRAKSVTQSGFEKCDRLFFKKSAVLASHEWRPCHFEAGGQNGPLLNPFQVKKIS